MSDAKRKIENLKAAFAEHDIPWPRTEMISNAELRRLWEYGKGVIAETIPIENVDVAEMVGAVMALIADVSRLTNRVIAIEAAAEHWMSTAAKCGHDIAKLETEIARQNERAENIKQALLAEMNRAGAAILRAETTEKTLRRICDALEAADGSKHDWSTLIDPALAEGNAVLAKYGAAP